MFFEKFYNKVLKKQEFLNDSWVFLNIQKSIYMSFLLQFILATILKVISYDKTFDYVLKLK